MLGRSAQSLIRDVSAVRSEVRVNWVLEYGDRLKGVPVALNVQFPALPTPLDSIERKRLTRKVADWASKPGNGEVLGRVFARLVRAFEFEWVWSVFELVSRHDTKSGKFTDHLPLIGELLGQHLPIERLTTVYLRIQECLREGWRLHAGVPAVSLGFAKRPEAMQWLPILQGLSKCIDRQYLSSQIEEALSRLIPFDNRAMYPFATPQYLSGLVELLQDESRLEKWTTDIEDRQTSAEDHERRLDLIQEAVQIARDAQHPGGPFAAILLSLISLGEFTMVEGVVSEIQRFSPNEQRLFRRGLNISGLFELQKVSHEGAIRALSNVLLSCDADAGSDIGYAFEYLGIAAIKLGLLSWWLEFTETCLKQSITSTNLLQFASHMVSLASRMDEHEFAHCPSDFWRSFADIAPAAECKSTILSKLAVKK